jgi:hypothetical protein
VARREAGANRRELEGTLIVDCISIKDRFRTAIAAKNTKAAPATGLYRGLGVEPLSQLTHKAGVTRNNTPHTPTL